MKKTKKRALLSAIAMLVVSAVVLSSATFAWFIVGDSASVTDITATVDSGSSVQVAAVGSSNWTSSISIDDLPGAWNPTALSAVSTSSPTSKFYVGTLNSDNTFSSLELTNDALGAGQRLMKFSVQVKSSKAGDVLLTSSAITGTNILNAVYVAIVEGSDVKIYCGDKSTSLTAYNGFNAAISATDKSPFNTIISDDEIIPLGATLPAVATKGDIANHVLDFENDGDTKTLTVYMWLEGQDEQCTGSVSTTAALSLVFNKPIAP